MVRDSLEAWRVVTLSAENEGPEKSRERERRFRRTDMGMKTAGLAVLSPKPRIVALMVFGTTIGGVVRISGSQI